MASASRYEIVDTLAAGDFATVYRGRDRELGREVAIKQIHEQFLGDPRQLERYWREAQLLASLQHPNILTIYDVDRPRGWLILELMRGSLQQNAQTGPIDLDALQVALVCTLSALHFLHTNGVIHGDVKPSNMLVDARGRVKLGDFGLARRASNEQGSLLKGTTKYMAPELVSNQFGPVGPASDLYSLGFSAYELMCGPQFESLFPGLATFGRDRQIAWLMWHAAPDRNMPPIARVLAGVPEDLARVVERLVVKDPSRRYATARDALHDLRAGRAVLAADGLDKPREEAPPPDTKKRLTRLGAFAALAVSLVLCAIMLFSGRAPEPKEVPPLEGVVHSVNADRRILAIDTADGNLVELTLRPDDRFFVNDNRCLFGELAVADRVVVKHLRDASDRKVTEVYATRPKSLQGRIESLEPDAGRLAVAARAGGQAIPIVVPDTVKILFNGQDKLDGRPVRLADLRVGDRVTLQHVDEEDQRVATTLAAERIAELRATIRAVEPQKRQITVEQGQGSGAKMVVLDLAPDCKITLNNSTKLDGRLLGIADLKPDDEARISRDLRVVSIDATRVVRESGRVQAVQPTMVEIVLQGQDKPKGFLVDATNKIALGGEPVQVEDLRAGDQIEVAHDAPSPNAPNPRALSIAAHRPEDRTRWAILIGIQSYDDATLGAASYAAADAQLLRDALVKRHAVAADQALLLTDASLVQLTGGIASLLGKVQATDHLVVYFAGHAWRDAEGTIHLAPKEFNRKQPAATGLNLQGLVDQLEACPAKDKLLILDACHAAPGADPQNEPSTAEMFLSLRAPPGQAPLRTVTGLASCSEGQRGQVLPERKQGLFAWSLSEGYSGRADKNRDGRVEPTELVGFLAESMKSASDAIQHPQTARLFLPDNKPPRLTEEARKAIRDLAVLAVQNQADLAGAKQKFAAASGLAAKEPEPKLLFALIQMKFRQRAEAERQFEELRIAQPEMLLPIQSLAWLAFDKRDYPDGVRHLTELVGKVPRPKKPGEPYPAELQPIFTWVGRLREFAPEADDRRALPPDLLQQVDAAVSAHGEPVEQLYQQGRQQARKVIEDFDARIASADSDALKGRLRIERRQLGSYAAFPFEAAVQSILAGLER